VVLRLPANPCLGECAQAVVVCARADRIAPQPPCIALATVIAHRVGDEGTDRQAKYRVQILSCTEPNEEPPRECEQALPVASLEPPLHHPPRRHAVPVGEYLGPPAAEVALPVLRSDANHPVRIPRAQ